MKHTGLILVFSLLAAVVVGQELPPWQLLVYPAGPSQAQEEVTELAEQGYVPVGMEIEPGESLTILVVRGGDIQIDGWIITDYDDWNALEDEITASIRAGLVPMDISRYGDSIAILWVEASLPIDSWRIHADENSVTNRISAVNSFQSQGYSLWGFSTHEDMAWYLFLRQDGRSQSSAIAAYEKDAAAMRTGINDSTAGGWLPSSLGVSPEKFFIGYIK